MLAFDTGGKMKETAIKLPNPFFPLRNIIKFLFGFIVITYDSYIVCFHYKRKVKEPISRYFPIHFTLIIFLNIHKIYGTVKI